MFERLKQWLQFAPMQSKKEIMASRDALFSEQVYEEMLRWFSTIPDPDLLLQKAGVQRHMLRQLELDDEISGRLEDRVSALIATPWAIEPNESKDAEFITDQLGRVIEAIDRATVSAVAYGYSMSEMVYSDLGGSIGIDSFAQCPIEWFQISGESLDWRYFPSDGTGGTLGLECSPLKFFPIVRNPTRRNPYGESLLSRLWYPVTWRHEGWGMWLNFLTTFGQPIVMGMVSDPAGFVAAMRAQGTRSVIAWQGDDKDKVQTVQPSTAGEFERMELALTKRIQKLILGNTMTTDGGQYGSRASGEVGLQVEDTRRLADVRLSADVCQRVVTALCYMNKIQPLRFVRRDETGIEQARAERDKNLAPVLASSGLQLTRGYFVNRYDLADDDIEPASVAVAPVNAGMAPTRSLTFAAGDTGTVGQGQQAIDDLVIQTQKAAGDFPLDPELIREAVMQASNPNDLNARMLKLFADADNKSPAFQRALEMAHFAAEVIGYVSADERTL